jgi:hypothetical protein
MSTGAGKYDDVATLARETAKAEGVMLIILNGEKGSGFSAQLNEEMLAHVPDMLRQVASDIEKDLERKDDAKSEEQAHEG